MRAAIMPLKGEPGCPDLIFGRVPVHSGKNLREETRFGFSKNPTGEFLKSRAMKEGGRFCEHPLLPHRLKTINH